MASARYGLGAGVGDRGRRLDSRTSGEGREVPFDDLAVVVVGDPVEGGGGLRLPRRDRLEVTRREVGTGHGLIGRREVKVGRANRLVDGEAATGVPEGRLPAPEDRVDPGALPLATGAMDGLADLAPVEPRGVRAVDHLVVL